MIEALRDVLKAIFAGAFGSQAGNFGYPIGQRPSVAMAVAAVALLALVLVTLRLTLSRIHTHERLVIGVWLVVASVAHIVLAQLAYAKFSVVVESTMANGFYSVAHQYSAGELLARYHELAETFSTHPRANLPGKVLLYEALESVTSSTQGIAYLIVLISNLGGVLVYALAKRWFADQLTAFYSLLLYLFLPARIYFFPLLNTVSPLFVLLVFLLMTNYLRTRQTAVLLLAGIALFWLTIFDPLTLVSLPLVAALFMKAILDGRLTWSTTWWTIALVAASFTGVYVFVRFVLGFDLIAGFRFILADARAFNVRASRPYSVWVVHNLKDFFLNMGLAQSIVFLACAGLALRRLATSPRESVVDLDVTFPVLVLTIVLALDLAGVNRGESVRLWIFLGVLMQVAVARALVIWNQRRLVTAVLSASIVQTTICNTIVAWIIP